MNAAQQGTPADVTKFAYANLAPRLSLGVRGIRKEQFLSKIRVGEVIDKHSLVTIQSGREDIPDPNHLVHLQFRRYAGCPFCSLHLHSFIKRHNEITAAGIREVIVFYSSADALLPYFGSDTPFAVIADPNKKLYLGFGVEPGWRAILNPRVVLPALRGISAKGLRLPRIWKGETPLGLPVDFLIGENGRVLACKYGSHAYDQWSVDDLLEITRHAENSKP